MTLADMLMQGFTVEGIVSLVKLRHRYHLEWTSDKREWDRLNAMRWAYLRGDYAGHPLSTQLLDTAG